MLEKKDRVKLRHMLDAASKAVRLAKGRSRATLDDEDDPLRDALVRLVSVVGEGARQVSPDAQAALDRIPWPDVIGMRHRLVHQYFDVDLDILWATVQHSLPDLITILESALPAEENP
jgi:uncharacterized protein with HEPN domain